MNKNIVVQKKELKELTEEIDSFSLLNGKTYDAILESINQLRPKISSAISDHHKSLLNYKKYFFNIQPLKCF